MKCSKCGHRTNTIQSMAEHYRKKHPNSMKHHKKHYHQAKGTYGHKARVKRGYCPSCGEYLG